MSPFRIFERHPHADISTYADRELAPELCERLEQHLEGCTACRDELATLRAITSAFSDLPAVAAPRSFALRPEQVADATREKARQPVSTPAFVGMRIAGAGIAAVLAVVVLLDSGGTDFQTSTSDNDSALTAESTAVRGGDEAGAPRDTELLGGAYGDEDSPTDITNNIGDANGGDDSNAQSVAPGGVDSPAESDLPATTNLDEADGDSGALDPAEDADDASESQAFEQGLNQDDNGISTLLLIEIALGVIAVTAIGGSFLLPRIIRKDN